MDLASLSDSSAAQPPQGKGSGRPSAGGSGDDKASLRRHFRALRRASLAAAQDGLRAMALAQLPGRLPPGLALGLYWPVGGEPDLMPLAAGGLAEPLAGRLALPAVLAGAAGPERLVYLPWEGTPPRGRDACGIPAPLPRDGHGPVAMEPQALGLLLVPALAIDRRGIRLGSGGGWYDRLRADPAWRAVPALAVLPSACVAGSLPRDPWDVPFHGWLDEHGLHAVDGASDA